MARSLISLILGCGTAVITYAVSHNIVLAIVIGVGVALLAWIGHRIIDDLIEAVGDLF
ncbi:hypothetical protein AB0M57_04350 [Streptomyces sp. NPDC051597]|uniref:hypothetical protein n=1 Tax=Streptomyces sp. NPDC051597 TaxID=3155049 RepID=UPI003422B558